MHLTFKQYRALDLIIFTVLLCVFESVLTVIWNVWAYSDPFIPSLLFLILAIVYMRWGALALIPAVVCGVVVSSVRLLTDKSLTESVFVTEIIGNCFSAFILLFMKRVKKDRIKSSWGMTIAYASLIYIFIETGRAVAYLILSKDAALTLSYFATRLFLRDLVAYVLLITGVLIVRRIDGMFEDQKAYLFRLERNARK
ncbi:MAG: hypothetical protein ACI4M6_07085 [Christensenellaceae bacterium]